MEYKYKVNGKEYTVNVASLFAGKAQVFVNGTSYEVELETPVEPAAVAPVAAPAPAPAKETPKAEAPKAAPAPAPKAAVAPASGTPVKSPLPGTINDIKVNVGDAVKNGQVLLILEAMKMENEITAEQDGVVSAINVVKGDSVMEGTVLLTLA